MNADVYKVRDGDIVAKAIATKQLAIVASPAGGTQDQSIEPAQQEQPALTDAQVVRLAELGRRIEAHFGCPQDIEWCLDDDGFQIVQSRPITTLFPIPEVGDASQPCLHLGRSSADDDRPHQAAGALGLAAHGPPTDVPRRRRLFVDVTQALASPASRAGLLEVLGKAIR